MKIAKICEDVTSCTFSILALIHRGNRLLSLPTLAAIKREASDFGINRMANGGGFRGPVLFSAFSMT